MNDSFRLSHATLMIAPALALLAGCASPPARIPANKPANKPAIINLANKLTLTLTARKSSPPLPAYGTEQDSLLQLEPTTKNTTSKPLSPPSTTYPVADALPAMPRRLDVHEAIALALAQGPTVVGGKLDRESQRILNDAAARIFEPRASLTSSYERNTTVSASGHTANTSGNLGATTSLKTITQAEIKADLSRPLQSSDYAATGGKASISLTQPLLRGGGTRIGTLELQALSIAERSSVLGLEAIRRAAVADAFNTYYALYEARQSRGISGRALARARESETINQLLVETGRLARIDLLQTRADVARAELQAEQAERTESDAQRRLAFVLGLPPQTQFELPLLNGEPNAPNMSVADALKMAWARRIEVRTTEDAISSQRFGLERAQNNLLPGLNLSLRSERAVGRIASDGALLDAQRPSSNTVGLTMDIPLTRRDLLAARSAAAIGVQRAEIALNDLRVSIETEIRNAIDGFASTRRALALARTTLELQRGRLEADNEKLKVGRSSISQISNSQDSVRNAEREELSARLELVRKKFEFDQALGNSVELWSKPSEPNPASAQ